jgi:peptidoglycan/LPS O-acetylase OafA/YrhL
MMNSVFSFTSQAYSGLPLAKGEQDAIDLSSFQLKALLYAFLPSWAVRSRSTHTTKLHSTSWLDGLRGYAALVVTLMHYAFVYGGWANPYSFGPLPADEVPLGWTSYLQLPIIRIWEQGSFSVTIFMVISGYVLAFRKVLYIRDRNLEKLTESMFSSIVRRPARLFLPVIGGLFLMQLGESLGMYSQLMSEWPSIEDWQSVTPTQAWVNLIKRILDLWDAIFLIDAEGTKYFGFLQFWTIPVEFTDSLIMFMIMISVCRMSYRVRVFFVSAIALTCLLTFRWALALFLVGYIIAETEANRSNVDSSPLETLVWSTVFCLSLILGSFPHKNAERDALLWWVRPLIPDRYNRSHTHLAYFPYSIAAVMLVKSIFRLKRLQALFTTRFGQYIGELSYSLYAVHYVVQKALRPTVEALAKAIFGEMKTNFTRDMGMIFQLIIITFFTLWLADLFWRVVDKPSVRAARWISQQVLSTEPEVDAPKRFS